MIVEIVVDRHVFDSIITALEVLYMSNCWFCFVEKIGEMSPLI
jgi:hypothetical protein